MVHLSQMPKMFGIMSELRKSGVRLGKYQFVLSVLIPVCCLERILRLRQGSVGKLGWTQKDGIRVYGKRNGSLCIHLLLLG